MSSVGSVLRSDLASEHERPQQVSSADGADGVDVGATPATNWLVTAKSFIEGLGPMRQAVLNLRLLAFPKPTVTLEEVGRRVGLTRERVRQVEVSLKKDLDAFRASERSALVRAAAEAIETELGPVYTERELQSVLSGLRGDVDALSRAPIEERFVRWFCAPTASIGPYLVNAEFKRMVLDELARAVVKAAVDETSLRFVLEHHLGVRAANLDGVIALLDGVRLYDGRFIAWSGTLADKAAVILQAKGEPMTVDSLHIEIGEGGRTTLANYLSQDSRFRRRTKTSYALAEWELPEYTTIPELMLEVIDGAGGVVDLDHVVATLQETYDVNPASVAINASLLPGIVLEEGRLRRRRDDEPYLPDDDLEGDRRCYKIGETWALRLTVDDDVLRGSGTALPEPIAARIGLRPGDRREFAVVGGSIAVYWSSQSPSLGSVRRVAEQLNAESGDVIFLAFPTLDRIEPICIRREHLERGSCVDQLVAYVGSMHLGEVEDVVEVVAKSVGLEPTASIDQVESRLLQRGDRVLAELFRSATADRRNQHLDRETLINMFF